MPLDGSDIRFTLSAKDLTGGVFNQFQNKLRQMEGTLAGVQKGFSGIQTFLGRLQAGAAAFGLSLGIGEFVAFNRQIMDTVGGLGELAQQLGISTTALQAYQTAALQSGVKAQQFEQSLIKLNRTMGDALGGDKKSIEAFSELGVRILDVNGKLRSSDSILAEVARRVMALGTEAEKTAAMNKLFGESGARLLPMLPELAKGVGQLTAEARAAGTLIEQGVIDKLDKASDQAALARKKFEATFARDVTLPMIEGMTWILNLMNQQIEKAGDLRLAYLRAFSSVPGAGGAFELMARLIEEQNRQQAAGQVGGIVGGMIGSGLGGGKPDPGGAFNPTPRGTSDRFGEQMRSMERDAARFAERLAMLKADTKTAWPEFERQLDSIEQTEKRIADLTKGMPANSPMAVQLSTQAIMTEKARLELEKYQRAVVDADRFERQFGDGTLELTETLHQLDAARATGRLSLEAYTIAVQQAREEQERHALVMQGMASQGWDGFIAGIRLAQSEWDRANSAFEQGQRFFERTMQGMEDALTQFVTTGKLNFRDLANSIIGDLIRMQVRAASTSLFGLLTNAIGNALGGGVSGSSGQRSGDYYNVPARAAGGPVTSGSPYMVGERGPELFVPDRSGTIYPNGTGPGMGGVTVRQSFVVNGGDEAAVNRAMAQWLPVMRQEALAAVLEARQRGGRFAQAFRQ
ncbi:hypothetical protein FHP25_35870 [Vineibacter terrae]|uniref:Uncharacterized protein n=1 Tax=Vineibacter terrae TaxID=2586908 RepID=A0A5C8P8I1_9HYPH|nr:phage tail tape measure C-terminal domain-containing protein [Vineibacter terrae]TXL70102.1 hypothetical protein FHP25_35870 [Vineibacter terrae]